MRERTINYAILDRILPEYKKISQAPNLSDVVNEYAERQKLYKSIDSRTGDIFLVQNPAVWARNAAGDLVRPAPKFVMKYDEAVLAARDSNKSEAKEGWGI